MIFRRVMGSVTVAAMLALAPAAAYAYTGADEAVVVSETNPAPGEPVQILVEAGADSETATLEVVSQEDSIPNSAIEIAGAQSMTKSAVAGGATPFTVTLHVEGNYALTGYNDAGEVVGQATLVVGDGVPGEGGAAGGGDAGDDGAAAGGAAAGGGDGAAAGDDVAAAGGFGLGDTGAGPGTAILGGAGALLVLAGGGLLLARRRKESLA